MQTESKQTHSLKSALSPPSSIPVGCDSYNVLNDPTRKTTFYSKSKSDWSCDKKQEGRGPVSPDWKGEGWYRVVGPAGTKLADTPTKGYYYCGTAGSRYVQGNHPTKIGETVSTKACFYRKSNYLCVEPQNVKIRNCGKYFIYYLPETTGCWQGYCTV